ncbi:hypothetical protein K1719_043101 [Acacia pycnantha]|nr:hypothetical protein K1719_043101 [Acacia pycnantha]
MQNSNNLQFDKDGYCSGARARRTEIAPDKSEKFSQKFQQVQQQGHSNLLGMPSLGGGNQKQFSAQQQNPLLQQDSDVFAAIDCTPDKRVVWLGLTLFVLGYGALIFGKSKKGLRIHMLFEGNPEKG